MQQPAAGGGMMSGMAGTVMTGMALGAGSEVGHQAVRAMMGSGSSGHGGEAQQQAPQQQQMAPQQQMDGQQYQQAQQDPCAQYNMNFVSCLKSSQDNIGMCQDYMNMLQ